MTDQPGDIRVSDLRRYLDRFNDDFIVVRKISSEWPMGDYMSLEDAMTSLEHEFGQADDDEQESEEDEDGEFVHHDDDSDADVDDPDEQQAEEESAVNKRIEKDLNQYGR